MASIEKLKATLLPVTVENFIRAESDMYFSGVVKNGGFGKFDHTREPAPMDKQTVIRLNRDTLYSAAIFDLDAAPVTITMPEAGRRFVVVCIELILAWCEEIRFVCLYISAEFKMNYCG